MTVPGLNVAMIALDDADPLFQQAPRDEQLAGLNSVSVHLADMSGFLADIKGVRGFKLHPVGQLEGLDPCLKLWVFATGALMFSVKFAQQIKLAPLGCTRDLSVSNVLDQISRCGFLRVDV